MSQEPRARNIDIMLADLFTDHTFTDVTIVCNDKVMIPAHKNILTSASPLMKQLLGEDLMCNTLVCTDISITEMKQLLQYIYLGKVSINKSQLKRFIDIANVFGIQHSGFREHDNLIHSVEISPSKNSENTNQKPKIYKCDHCDYETNFNSALRTHNNTKHDLIRFPCSLCDYWGSKSAIYQHMKNIHGTKFSSKKIKNKNKFNCDHCGKDLSRRDKLQEHIQRKHARVCNMPESGPTGNEENICGTELENVKQDTIIHHSANIEPDDQRAETVSISSITPIEMKTTDNSLESIESTQLFSVDNSRPERTKELNTLSESKNYPILHSSKDMIDKLFLGLVNERKAATKARIRKTKNIKCNLCDMKFKSKALRNTHREAFHKQIQYPCTLCDYVGISKPSRYNHIRKKHEGEGRLQCKFCPMVKSKLQDLTIHIQDCHDNLGKYKFSCTQCDRKFTKTYHLKNHIKAIHEGVRFPCDQCEFKAMEPGNLRNHKLMHHDANKYPCPECDYWGNQVNLKNHMRNKHEQKMLEQS